MQLVRLIAVWCDDPRACVLTCDLCLGDDQHIGGHWDIMGVIDHNQKHQRPFVLSQDGVIDFGVHAPADQRYWSLSLHDKALKVGLEFDIEWPHHDRGRFRIEKLARLGSKEAQQCHDG
jgi:hypothetical protein